MFQDVFEHGFVFRIGVFAGQQWDDEDGLFPFGIEFELTPEVFSVLFEYMEIGDLDLVLREVSDGVPPFLCVKKVSVVPDPSCYRVEY